MNKKHHINNMSYKNEKTNLSSKEINQAINDIFDNLNAKKDFSETMLILAHK